MKGLLICEFGMGNYESCEEIKRGCGFFSKLFLLVEVVEDLRLFGGKYLWMNSLLIWIGLKIGVFNGYFVGSVCDSKKILWLVFMFFFGFVGLFIVSESRNICVKLYFLV